MAGTDGTGGKVVDAELRHLVTKHRQMEAMDRGMPEGGSDMRAEAALLGLMLVAGLSGLATSSVTITVTMFLGGLGTWMMYTLPDYVKQMKQRSSKQAAGGEPGAAGAPQQAGKGDTAAHSAPMPSPDEVMNLIQHRRSVFPKDYTGAKVARADIQKLLEAANWAPTHGKTEPWRFVVLEGDSKEAMEDLTMRLCAERLPGDQAAKTVAKLEGKKASTWGKTSAYIAICCKRQAKPDKLMPEWEELAATSCAVQNMWLMSTALGLAAYWTSWQEVAREAPEMKELLGLLPEDRVLGFFTLGRSDRTEGYRGSRGPWEDKVTWKA